MLRAQSSSSASRALGSLARRRIAASRARPTYFKFDEDSSYRGYASLSSSSEHDRLLVVGSGVAGSAAALIAADTYRLPVTLVYAGNSAVDCNSYWAQGGIIYRGRPEEDSAELLASDIHRAGAGLCDDAAVTKVAVEGPGRVEQLLLDYAKVPFDRVASGELSLCLEASHTAPRILHTADHTGKWITQSLAAAVARHPLITQCPHSVVVDLLTALDGATDEPACVGLTTLDRRTGKLTNLHASSGVLLASGGLAGIYQHSTNPAGFNALGSSVALARRAGAETRDLEFVQFHPTSLYIPQQPRFLLTEALRGEGGILRDSKGRAFARDYHEDGELAPRDVVARAVFSESQNGQVYLDITHRDATWLSSRFPSVQEYIKKYQLDLSKDWLPVIPAAHYTCGGIATDLSGRTSLRGLFAAGEAARTGLHGGNRLASTSLLEGLVFGSTVGDFCGTQGRNAMSAVVETSVSSSAVSRRRPPLHVEPAHIESAAHRAMQVLRKIRRTMWDQVGVERNQSGLASALESLRTFQKQAGHLYATCPTLETAAVRDAAHAGVAVAEAALANPVSAGAHYLVEEPALSPMGAHADDSDEDEGAVAAAR